MKFFKARNQIIRACHPQSQEEAIKLWSDLQSVKFGFSVQIEDPALDSYELAAYQIPEDANYLLILRTESYLHTFDVAAPDFDLFSPVPPGNAYWQYSDVSATFGLDYTITPRLPIHLLCDSEEILFAEGGNRVSLIATDIPANPDANARFIRTTVYGFLLGPDVADKIGSGKAIYFGG
jgi:hypothetical protein